MIYQRISRRRSSGFAGVMGYVFMAHGGGVTPVTQTVDTDLNHHVKRDYIAQETTELLAQMRDGVCVPKCQPELCVDMMVEVLSKHGLHLHAADGYLATGMIVALDGSQDAEVVREAGTCWRDLGMRAKINAAVAEAWLFHGFPDGRAKGGELLGEVLQDTSNGFEERRP